MVALAIAFVSILGAIVAFRASLSEQEAHRLDLNSLQESARKEQLQTDASARADDDLLHAAEYNEHLKAAVILDNQAKDATNAKPPNPALAAALSAQADSERVLARSLTRFFESQFPADESPKDATKPVKLDRDLEVEQILSGNPDYTGLKPEVTIQQAERAHTRAVYFLGIVTLFIASLLFLTLAQFTRPAVRNLFAGAGTAVSLAGVVLWVLTERIA